MKPRERYTSKPIDLPAADEPFGRADLEFYDVTHMGPSYEARIFLNNNKAHRETPATIDERYAGSFFIFGHGICIGDEGHCEVPDGPLNAYDVRPPHHQIGYRKTVTITDALKRVISGDLKGRQTMTVTIVADVRDTIDNQPEEQRVLRFSRLALVLFE